MGSDQCYNLRIGEIQAITSFSFLVMGFVKSIKHHEFDYLDVDIFNWKTKLLDPLRIDLSELCQVLLP